MIYKHLHFVQLMVQ